MIGDADPDGIGRRYPVLLLPIAPSRRQRFHRIQHVAPFWLPKQEHPVVVNEEERGRLTVVSAGCRPRDNIEKGRAELAPSSIGLLERSVVSGHTGGAGADDENCFLERAKWRGPVGAGVA